jgi:hypothetical protein
VILATVLADRPAQHYYPQQGEYNAMPMQLFFKRAKNFVDQSEGTKKFLAMPANYPQAVPFWVALTPTFKQGIKDGSIVNLTPPEQMPGYKYPAKPVETLEEVKAESHAPGADEDLAAETAAKDAAEANEQTQEERPQAPFGAQPMTPVQPGPKVGGITGNGKKAK